MTPERFPLVDNMRRYGGNFVSKLADAMVAADPENYGKLCSTFPDIIEKYTEAEDREKGHPTHHAADRPMSERSTGQSYDTTSCRLENVLACDPKTW